MTIMNPILKSSTSAGIQTLIAQAVKALPPSPSRDVEYEDGGNMAERMKASGLWHLIPNDLRAGMKQIRVVFHVDRKSRCIVGHHFATAAGSTPKT